MNVLFWELRHFPIRRVTPLSNKLLKHGFIMEHLKSSFRKCYGWYGDLINKVKFLSRKNYMIICSFTRCSNFPTNQSLHHLYYLDTEFDIYWISEGYHGRFATYITCQQRQFTHSDTLAGSYERLHLSPGTRIQWGSCSIYCTKLSEPSFTFKCPISIEIYAWLRE